MQNDIVRARISPEVKYNAEQVLGALGMSMSDAIRIFLSQVALRQAFPIELKVPNAITLQAMQSVTEPEVYVSADALFAEVADADD